jgi:hypothetical protein
MSWIFQGNPEMYAADDYVVRYPELIYWRTPRYASEIRVGDRSFLWRSGPEAGAIAIGTIVELPTLGTKVRNPEALGTDLWIATAPDPDEVKTGMHLDEIRLTAEEGTLLRDSVKNDDVLANSLVIRMPTGTVFPLFLDETMRLEQARVIMQDDTPSKNIFAAGEVMAGNILGRGYLAGFGLTIGSVFGRIAGAEAARHAGT